MKMKMEEATISTAAEVLSTETELIRQSSVVAHRRTRQTTTTMTIWSMTMTTTVWPTRPLLAITTKAANTFAISATR